MTRRAPTIISGNPGGGVLILVKNGLTQGWANCGPQQPFVRAAKALNKYFKKIINCFLSSTKFLVVAFRKAKNPGAESK